MGHRPLGQSATGDFPVHHTQPKSLRLAHKASATTNLGFKRQRNAVSHPGFLNNKP